MNVRFSYDKRFDSLIEGIKKNYGEDILIFSGVHPKFLDVARFTREFLFNGSDFAVADASVDSNANVDDKSVVSFDHEVAKALNKLNALNMIWEHCIAVASERDEAHALRLANEAIEDIITGALYLNDSHFAHKSYCYAFDLAPLVFEGMPFVKKIKIGPPRHYFSFIDLVIQSVAFCSNQIAGAVSLPNLLIYMEYFAHKDFGDRYWENERSLTQIRQGFQSLVYSLNFSFRGAQSSFTNMSIYDRYFLQELFANTPFPDGSRIDFDRVLRFQRIFIDWFNSEYRKQTFTFPVLTANMVTERGEILDQEFLDYVSEANLEFAFMNIYTGPATCLSSCCRLRSNLIREHTNSLGTGSVGIGSHRVCTINLPRIAIEAQYDRKRFMEILSRRLSTVHLILNAHRSILKRLILNGRLPLYTYGWMSLERQYSTVGLLGPYEACKFMGMDITSDAGANFVIEIMDYINERNSAIEKEYGDGRRFNLELIPGEQAAVRLCEADKMLYPSFNNPYKLYSNQFIPLIEKADIAERIRLQGLFDSRAQGGCIMHLNIDHKIMNASQMKSLIVSAARAGSLYFAVNYIICRCKNSHANIGKTTICHVCGEPIVQVMTRVVGFVTNVSDWNKVRREEFTQRVFYEEAAFDSDRVAACA